MIEDNNDLIAYCSLCCRLCPTYHTESKNKCDGCKSEYRMGAD